MAWHRILHSFPSASRPAASLPFTAGATALLSSLFVPAQSCQARKRRPSLRAEGPDDGASVPRPASWPCLQAYAADQVAERAAGRGPSRSPAIEERYRRYFRWLQSRGQGGAQYLELSAQWRGVHGGPYVALEPNIVPYELEAGIEHWNLWYHPGTTPGSADLDLMPGAEVELRAVIGALGLRGCILAVRRREHEVGATYEVSTSGGEHVKVARSEFEPCKDQRRWNGVLAHVRLFLPFLEDDEVVIYQNVRELRSVPDVAHAHVFIWPRTVRTEEGLRQLRTAWRLRSPWAEAERCAGRGDEVHWPSEGLST